MGFEPISLNYELRIFTIETTEVYYMYYKQLHWLDHNYLRKLKKHLVKMTYGYNHEVKAMFLIRSVAIKLAVLTV